MKNKKIASMILATTIVSGTMLGKNIITKANTITKNKEAKVNKPSIDFTDLRQHIKYRLDNFEEDLNDQYYENCDFSNKRTQLMINSLGDSETDNELKNRFKSLKQRYEKEKATGSKVGLIKRLKNEIDGQINLIKEAISNNRDNEVSQRIIYVEKKIKELNKYEDASNYSNEVKKLDSIMFNKKVIAAKERNKEVEKAKEKTLKEGNIIKDIESLENLLNNKNYENVDVVINQIKSKINEFNKTYKFNEDVEGRLRILEQKYLNEKSSKANKEAYEKSTVSKNNLVIPEQKIINNIASETKNKEVKMKEVINRNVDTLKNLLDNKEYNKAQSMINRINLEKSKLKETNVESNDLDKKVEELHNRYKDEKAKVVPIKVNELKEETNKLINNLTTQVKDKKDINEVNKTLNSVENKIEELKKYKKVSLAENTLKEIKNDMKNGKDIDSSKLRKLKDELDKSINSEEVNEVIENEVVKNMDEDEKALFNNEDTLKISDNELLEKEAKENKKSLAIKVGATVGTILLGASAFIINRRFRKK